MPLSSELKQLLAEAKRISREVQGFELRMKKEEEWYRIAFELNKLNEKVDREKSEEEAYERGRMKYVPLELGIDSFAIWASRKYPQLQQALMRASIPSEFGEVKVALKKGEEPIVINISKMSREKRIAATEIGLSILAKGYILLPCEEFFSRVKEVKRKFLEGKYEVKEVKDAVERILP
jgi:hypothetical protein